LFRQIFFMPAIIESFFQSQSKSIPVSSYPVLKSPALYPDEFVDCVFSSYCSSTIRGKEMLNDQKDEDKLGQPFTSKSGAKSV
jgi:hypothetical protein